MFKSMEKSYSQYLLCNRMIVIIVIIVYIFDVS